jgi:hypothetical protein
MSVGLEILRASKSRSGIADFGYISIDVVFTEHDIYCVSTYDLD